MKRFGILCLWGLSGLVAVGNTYPSEKRKNGPLIQEILAPVQVFLQDQSAVFYNDETLIPFLYGTVVREDGLILTKASELETVEKYHVRVGKKRYREVEVLARDEQWDVVLVKIAADDLKPVSLTGKSDVGHGTWVVSNGATERFFRRPALGVISANQRAIEGGSLAILGVGLKTVDGKLVVSEVMEGAGSEKAGLKVGDELITFKGQPYSELEALLEALKECSIGEMVELKVKRGEEEMEVKVEMMARHLFYGGVQNRNDQLSGGEYKQSARRTGFPRVLQHDAMMSSRTVGGPVFSLDGEFLGMNIASADRIETYAIPVEMIEGILKGLLGKGEELGE